jgi:hypothetical protein
LSFNPLAVESYSAHAMSDVTQQHTSTASQTHGQVHNSPTSSTGSAECSMGIIMTPPSPAAAYFLPAGTTEGRGAVATGTTGSTAGRAPGWVVLGATTAGTTGTVFAGSAWGGVVRGTAAAGPARGPAVVAPGVAGLAPGIAGVTPGPVAAGVVAVRLDLTVQPSAKLEPAAGQDNRRARSVTYSRR